MKDYSYNLSGKTALVTGGSRGIGEQVVRDLVYAGCNVIFTYSSSRGKSEALKKELLKIESSSVTCIKVDFTDEKEVNNLLDYLDQLGKVDYLINNAGIVRDKPMHLLENSDWDDVLAVNLTAVYKVTKRLIRKMAMTKGSIVNITSISGIIGNAGQTNYSASKAGLIGLTKSLSKELGPLGIRVNCIAPGYVTTDLSLASITNSKKFKKQKDISLRRYGNTTEISSCVLFLLSEASSYITGQTLIPDGGLI